MAKLSKERYGMEERIYGLQIHPPEKVTAIPTFDKQVFRDPTPMLQARFDYAGTWNEGGDIWLSLNEMPRWMKKRDVRQMHRSLREHWDNSPPMLFPDGQLSLFGIVEGVPDAMDYLVWSEDDEEPEIWSFSGMDSHKHKNLEGFLKWCLK